MTTLTIKQGNNIEIVSYAVILKLYETALNSTNVTLSGNLQCEHCFENAYNYLTGYVTEGVKRFPDLLINVTDGKYIMFADSVIDNYWANSLYGDGVGLPDTSIISITSFPERITAENTAIGDSSQFSHGEYAFYNDNTITSFNELGRFTNITKIPCSMFRKSSLKYIDFSNIVSIEAAAFNDADLTGVINLPKLKQWGGRPNSVSINMNDLHFGNNPNITEIHIGANVSDEEKITTIKNYTFTQCTGLTNITGLNKITKIENYAFKGCSNIENFQDLNSTASIEICVGSMESCSSLKCIDLTNATKLDNSSFSGCSSLIALDTNDLDHINDHTEYTLNVSSIGSDVFKNTDLTGKTIIMPNITKVTGSVFRSSKLSKFIGANVTEIGGGSFYGCSQLQEVLFGNVTKIGSTGAFYNCSNLTTIKFGNLINDLTSLQEIGLETFLGCGVQFPTNLSLPNLTSIAKSAFRGHTEIQTVTNLGQITELPKQVFNGCSITSFVLPSTLTTFLASAFDNTLVEQIIGTEGLTVMGFGLFVSKNNVFRYIEVPSTVTDIQEFFHRCLELGYPLDTAICVMKPATPPALAYYASNHPLDYDGTDSKAAKIETNAGASRFLGIYVPDASLSLYQAATGPWQESNIQARLKPISQLLTDSPTYWAVYQQGLSNS